ncbi:MAG: hypothetical protein HY094_06435 [Candidatus Melainabacteria bacterium]|nr:hypothetical protein [Candidatus Melainabacteria bacterium]
MKKLNKKAIISALAISLGAVASAQAVENALKDPLFSLKEIGSQSVLLAQESKGGEAKCGEGKCGADKKGTEATTKAKSQESKCGEGKCGVKKIKKVFKKGSPTTAKSAEAKCGEGKCGADKKGTEAKSGTVKEEKKN